MTALPPQLGVPEPCHLCPTNPSQTRGWRHVHSSGEQDRSLVTMVSSLFLTGRCRPSLEHVPSELFQIIMVDGGLGTQDILRCSLVSRTLRCLLTDKALVKVWQVARTATSPCVPPPQFGISELRWASFLFGNRQCCICHELTTNLPISYTNMLIQCTSCSDNYYKQRLNVIRPFTSQEYYAARFLFPLDFHDTDDVLYYWKPSLDKLVRELVEAHGEYTTRWPKLRPDGPRPVELREEYVSVRQGAKYYRYWKKAVQAARKRAATSNANRVRKWSQKKNLKYIALRESAPEAMRALDYSTERMEVLDGAAWSKFKERIEQEVLSNTLAGLRPVAAEPRASYIERVFGVNSGITEIPEIFRGRLRCNHCCQAAQGRYINPLTMRQFDHCGLAMHLKNKHNISIVTQADVFVHAAASARDEDVQGQWC